MIYFKKVLSILSILTITLFITGCSGRAIYIQSVPAKVYKNYTDKPRIVSSSASGFQLLLFIPIETNTRQKRAYDMLKAQANGNYLSDVTIKESWTWAFVGTVYTTEMTAKVYPRD